METEKQKQERYKLMDQSLFAQFKQQGVPVPGKNGVVSMVIDGDEYQLKKWSVRQSLHEWDTIWRRYGNALLMGMLGLIRYQTRRPDEDGRMLIHLPDIERGENLLAAGANTLLENIPEGEGLYKFVMHYFPKRLSRKVVTPKKQETWVEVLDLSPQREEDKHLQNMGKLNLDEFEDVREIEGMPIGFDNFYIGKQSTIFKLIFWIFAENLGGFFLDKIQDTHRKAQQEETMNSMSGSKQGT